MARGSIITLRRRSIARLMLAMMVLFSLHGVAMAGHGAMARHCHAPASLHAAGFDRGNGDVSEVAPHHPAGHQQHPAAPAGKSGCCGELCMSTLLLPGAVADPARAGRPLVLPLPGENGVGWDVGCPLRPPRAINRPIASHLTHADGMPAGA